MATSGDRVAEFLIGLGLEGAEVKGLFAGVKSQLKSDVAELQSIADKLDIFGAITDNIPKVSSALDKARAEVKKFKDEIRALRESSEGKFSPTKELSEGLAKAEAAAKAAGAELRRQTTTATNLGQELAAAGVKTKNFATEQARLSEAVKRATADLQLQQSKDLLGFKSLSDVKPRIDELNKAFETLKASGKLSTTEIATAQSLLRDRISAVNAEVSTLGTGVKTAWTGVGSAISGITAPILAVTAAFAGTIAVINSAVNAAKEFQTALSQLGAATNLSKQELAELGEGARTVAREFGFTVAEAQKALFDIIRSGVPKENALFVLREAATAARAEFGNLDDAVKASDALLSGYGESVTDLRKDFDILIRSYANGGVSIAEFGANAGKAGNIARAAGLQFGEFVAVLEVLRKNGLDAGESFSALEKIVQRFADPQVKDGLSRIGIDTKNLVTALQQIAQQQLPISVLGDLGLTSSKTAAGVATLTNNADQLPAALARIAEAAGAGERALQAFYDSPAGRSAAFNAALEQAALNLGEIFGPTSIIGVGATKVLDIFNQFNDAVRAADAGSTRFLGQVDIFVSRLLGIEPAAQNATRALAQFVNNEAITSGIKKIDADLAVLQAKFNGLAKSVAEDVRALIEATTQSIAQINARSEAEIAALGKRQGATAETIAAITALEQKAVNDRFAALKDGEEKILAALKKSGEDRLAAAKGNAAQEKAVAQDVARDQIATLGQVLGQWQQHYRAVLGLAQEHQQRQQAFERERLAFNETIETQLFNLRVAGLSPFDQYLAKVREVERLADEARTAGANKEFERAKELTARALDVSKTITSAVSASGVEIISQEQAQETQIRLTKGIREDYNKTLAAGAKLEGEATKALIDSAKAAREEIDRLQQQYDGIKKSFDGALKVKVEKDLESFAAVSAEIAELTKTRTVLIQAQTANQSGFGGTGATGGFNRGGYVARPGVQGFAAGGGVFKVPGIGDADTVPALLREGSFVLRKSASQLYGDGLLGSLSGLQRFATGGQVFTPGPAALRILGANNAGNIAAALSLGGDPDLRAVKNAATDLIYGLLNSMGGIPHGSQGQDYSQFLRNLWEAIMATTKVGDARALYEPIAQLADSIRVAIAQAQQFHVPLLFGTNTTDRDPLFRSGKPSEAFLRLGRNELIRAFAPIFDPYGRQTNLLKFAGGGGVGGDTVPALLTPGEMVIPAPTVAALGSDFFDALNRMTISRSALASFAAPPRIRGFADGGPVPGALIPRAGSASGSAAAGGLSITINAAGGDLTNPATVRRIARVIRDEIERRSQ